MALRRENLPAADLDNVSVVVSPAAIEMRSTQDIRLHFLDQRLVAFHFAMNDQTREVRVGEDFFDKRVTSARVAAGHFVSERTSDPFYLEFEMPLLLVEKRLPVGE